MNKMSVKIKITLWYTIIMLVISITALFVMLSVSREILINDSITRLVESVNRMMPMINDPRRNLEDIPNFRFFNNGVHTAIYDADGKLIKGFIPFEFIENVNLTNDTVQAIKYNGEEYLVYMREVMGNRPCQIRGVISISDEGLMLDSVKKTNLIMIFIFVAAAALGGYLITKNALKPVSKISDTAKNISKSKDLSQRISLGKGNDELHSLANTFDEMLDKLEDTLEKEKQFTSDASHELRTPIAVITSECEYALEYASSLDEAKESISSIKRQTDRMAKLVSQLLTIARMDRKSVPLNFEMINLSELLKVVCDEQADIHEDNIKLTRHITPDVYAMVDSALIIRLLVNLIDNAYSYGKDNGEITVSLSQNADNIICVVADDGIGIAEENINKIWERFYRADESRTGNSGSMGLGLSMVKWIAQCHNGNISVESELGVGSTFTLVLPKNI